MHFDCAQEDTNRKAKTPPLYLLTIRTLISAKMSFDGPLLRERLPHYVHDFTRHYDDLLRGSTLQLLLCLFMGHYGQFDFVFAHI